MGCYRGRYVSGSVGGVLPVTVCGWRTWTGVGGSVGDDGDDAGCGECVGDVLSVGPCGSCRGLCRGLCRRVWCL